MKKLLNLSIAVVVLLRTGAIPATRLLLREQAIRLRPPTRVPARVMIRTVARSASERR